MSSNVHKYGLLAIKALLTVAFVAAGSAKLLGAEMMVQTFEAVGVGQWELCPKVGDGVIRRRFEVA